MTDVIDIAQFQRRKPALFTTPEDMAQLRMAGQANALAIPAPPAEPPAPRKPRRTYGQGYSDGYDACLNEQKIVRWMPARTGGKVLTIFLAAAAILYLIWWAAR